MRRLEDFVNRLSDADWGWWPLLRLRPPQHIEMDNLMLLRLSGFAGSVLGLTVVYPLSRNFDFTPDLFAVLLCMVAGWLLFFILYKYGSAYFWNRRARRLQSEQQGKPPV